ncbi:MAG: hypothetical protein MJZ34_12810, partial [Paludibacteraceae bacterium]|nr:hypothetical protein [Paludibacteraceae bacterium]
MKYRKSFFATGWKRVALFVISLLTFAVGAEAAYVVTYPEGKTSADPGDVVTITFDENITNFEFNYDKLDDCSHSTSDAGFFDARCGEPEDCPTGSIFKPTIRNNAFEITVPSNYTGSVYSIYYGTRSSDNFNFIGLFCYNYKIYTYGGQVNINVHTESPVIRSEETCFCPSSTIIVTAENFNHVSLSWSYTDAENGQGTLTATSLGGGKYEVNIPSSVTSDITITAKGGTTETASVSIPMCIPEIQNAPDCVRNNATFEFDVINACPSLSYRFNNQTYSGASSYHFSAKFTGNNQPQTFTLYQGNKAVRSFTVRKCDVTLTCSENVPSTFTLSATECYKTIDDVKNYINPTQRGGTEITDKVYYFNEDGGDFKSVSSITKFVPGKTYIVRAQVYVDDAMVGYCETKEFTIIDNTTPVIESGLEQEADATCDESKVPDLSDFVIAHTTDNCEVTFVSQSPVAGTIITEDTPVTVTVKDNSNTATGTVTIHPNTVLVTKTADTTAVACDSFTWYGKTYDVSGVYSDTFATAAGCDSIVTLNLTINKSISVDTIAVACDSFTWYGKTYDVSGVYSDTFAT